VVCGFSGGKRVRGDREGRKKCGGKLLDASTSDVPPFSVAIYVDFTEAALATAT